MKENLLVVILVSVLMISACRAQSPAESTAMPPPTESPTAAQIPTFTATPPVEASTTPTPETPVPTNPPDCTNSAAFVADVTIADNEFINGGSDFTKTWRVKNTGTCVWGPDYTLAHYSGDRMFAPASVPLSVTYPGQTVDISMQLSAPTTDGKYTGFFVIKNPAGLVMKVDNDSRLWVIINVSSQVAAATDAAIPVTGNGLVSAACAFTTDSAKVTDVITALNAYRADNGLPAYMVNELLTKAAVAHANDMACNQLFGHDGSDGSTFTTRVAASGYNASSVTENVYGSYPPLTGQGAVDWWKNDKTDVRHNQNMLSAAYTEIGVGYSFFNNFGYYVLVFAKPK
ncbi:hypothetical protein ANAEL_03673 [Anaerolineales bacterium]|nr:hypothetical protein ANAEL_03673 [Anaerolineales bacterium]